MLGKSNLSYLILNFGSIRQNSFRDFSHYFNDFYHDNWTIFDIMITVIGEASHSKELP